MIKWLRCDKYEGVIGHAKWPKGGGILLAHIIEEKDDERFT